LMKSAHELRDKFNEFEALLEKSGEKTDAALREQLKSIWTGLSPIVHSKTPEEHVPAGQVEFHIDARMLNGSMGTFREAHVVFEERHIVIHVVDCGGDAWTLRSTKLPGPIIKEQSRFMLSKTGEDLRVTLTKATADAAWHQKQIQFREQAHMSRSSSNTRSTGSNCGSSQISHFLSAPAEHATPSKMTQSRSACSSSSQGVIIQIHGCKAPANLPTSKKSLTVEPAEKANYEKVGTDFF